MPVKLTKQMKTFDKTAKLLYLALVVHLKAIAFSGHGKMKMNRLIIEHLGLLSVVVVICDISE